MPVAKRVPPPNRDARFLAARRAAAAPPKSDPTGEHTAALREMADATGRDLGDLLDDWAERAAIRTYDGCQDIREAERLAVEDVREMVTGQRRMI